MSTPSSPIDALLYKKLLPKHSWRDDGLVVSALAQHASVHEKEIKNGYVLGKKHGCSSEYTGATIQEQTTCNIISMT